MERGGREEAEGLMTKGRGYYYDRGSGEEGVGVAGGREGGEVVTEVVIAESYSRCLGWAWWKKTIKVATFCISRNFDYVSRLR